MILGDIHALHEVVGLLEEFLGLTTRAHNHVHANKSVGHHLANLLYLVAEQGRVVLAVHEFQHLVAATLQGDVKMGHECTRLCTILDDFICQQVGLNARDAVAFNTFHPIECLHQVEEGLTRGASEIAYIDARDDNLLATLLYHFLGLLHQRGDTAIAAASTGNGDGTISTIIITSVLHLQEIASAVATRAARRKTLDVRCLHSIGSCHSLKYHRDDVAFLLTSQHQVHTGGLHNLLGLQLRIAAGHHHKRTRMRLHQTVNGLPALMVGHFRHAARVHHHHIGHFPLLCFLHSVAGQLLRHRAGLRKVQLATQCKIGRFLSL